MSAYHSTREVKNTLSWQIRNQGARLRILGYGKKENNKLEEFKNRCFVKEKGEEEEKSPAETIETAEIQGQRTKPIQQAKKKKKGNK